MALSIDIYDIYNFMGLVHRHGRHLQLHGLVNRQTQGIFKLHMHSVHTSPLFSKCDSSNIRLQTVLTWQSTQIAITQKSSSFRHFNIPYILYRPPSLKMHRLAGIFIGGKATGREIILTITFTYCRSEEWVGWYLYSPVSLHSVDTDNSTFTFLYIFTAHSMAEAIKQPKLR
jgi:hypothetical protein